MTACSAVQTLPELLRDRVATYGNREFLRFDQQRYGFADLEREAQRVAAGLAALGVGKGDKVALMLNNCPEYLFCWFGLAMLGAVEVPINTAHRGTLLQYLLEQSESRMVVVDPEFVPQLEQVIGDVPSMEAVVVLGEYAAETSGLRWTSYQQVASTSAKLPAVSIQASDPLAIMFTSGTTGPSKGAVVPQHYPLAMGRILAECAEYSDEDCLYNALPLFHGNAQFLSTVPALLSGARMVLARRFSASQFWQDVRAYGCTEFNYIGGIIPILLKAAPDERDADNPLRVMVGAGAPADLSEAFEKRFGVRLMESYGMSEIGIPVTNTLARRKLGSCGSQHPDYDVLLVGDDGVEVGPGQPGELLVRPRKRDSMMLEYYRMPEQTVESWQNLWFHTGDYLMRDAEGFYYFVDRKKDALRRRGENISSYEVEKEINVHPSVLESAAVAVKSELGEDEVMIVVCLKPGEALSPQALLEHCRSRMAYFMVPRYVRFVQKMPKTPTERIQKFELRRQGVTADTYDREAVA